MTVRASAVLLILVRLGLAAAGQEETDKAMLRQDKKALQGGWQVVSVETEGEKLPAEKIMNLRVVFGDRKMTILEGNKTREEFTFAIDPAKKPKAIDLTATSGPRKGQTILGIYDVVGNVLKLCDSQSNRHRPKTFETSRDSDFVAISLVLHRDNR